jgi:hypothetical protein
MNEKSLITKWVEGLDPELRYEFEERAGIMEFDGQSTRQEAEFEALILLFQQNALRMSGLFLFRPSTDILLLTSNRESAERMVQAGLHPVDLVELVQLHQGEVELRIRNK